MEFLDESEAVSLSSLPFSVSNVDTGDVLDGGIVPFTQEEVGMTKKIEK